MQSLRNRIAVIAGAAAIAGLTASLFLTIPALTQAQAGPPGPGRPGGERGQPGADHEQHRQQYLTHLATNLGVTAERLQEAFKQTHKDLVGELLQAGRITQEQADKMIARIDQGGAPGMHGPGHKPGMQGPGGNVPGPRGARGRVPGPQDRAMLGGVSQIVGMSPQELREALRGGKTLLQIASDKGISQDQLKSSLISAMDQRLNEAVQAGRLTAEQAAQMKQRHEQFVDRLLQGFGPGGPGRPGRQGPGQPPQ